MTNRDVKLVSVIVNSKIVSAFAPLTIGTKVLDASAFVGFVEGAVAATDFGTQRVPGQAFVMLPVAAHATVSAGCGRRTLDPSHYVARIHRGEVGLYLTRSHAAPVEGLAVVIYTAEAYRADPDVLADAEELARIEGASHVLVAVLGFAGPKSPLPVGTFVHNLAGGNREAALYSADEIRRMAAEIEGYWGQWSIVAD
jgi:hypothetical protein